MKKLLLATLIMCGCAKEKVPAFIWTTNRCQNQWIQFEDGTFDVPYPGAAAGAQRLTVPCTPSPDVNGSVVWTVTPYK